MKYQTVAKRFTEILAKQNITARELSDKSGVSEASISQYCSGTHKPSNISSGKIAEVLNVNPLWGVHETSASRIFSAFIFLI